MEFFLLMTREVRLFFKDIDAMFDQIFSEVFSRVCSSCRHEVIN